ncbi:unnamed protein product [Gadus morhua 'NCC']
MSSLWAWDPPMIQSAPVPARGEGGRGVCRSGPQPSHKCVGLVLCYDMTSEWNVTVRRRAPSGGRKNRRQYSSPHAALRNPLVTCYLLLPLMLAGQQWQPAPAALPRQRSTSFATTSGRSPKAALPRTPRPASRRPPRRRPRPLSSPLQQALAVLSPCGRSEWVQAPAALPAANTPRQGGGEREQPGSMALWQASLARPPSVPGPGKKGRDGGGGGGESPGALIASQAAISWLSEA